MSEIKSFFQKTGLIFLIAGILGLIVDLNTEGFKTIVDALLGIVMFMSIRPFFKHKFHIKHDIKYIVISLLLNYVVLSGVYLILASIFFSQIHEYFIGFVLVAIVPPAISIVPLSYLSKGDPETADASLFASYFIALVLLPLLMFLFFGQGIDMWILFRIMLIIIIIPTFFAYIARHSRSKIFHHAKIIINICMGLLIFIGLSINNDAIFIEGIWPVYLISFLAVFVTGTAVYWISKKGYGKFESVNFSLYASHKNLGMALAIALLMFSPSAAVPAIIVIIMQLVYFLIFEKWIRGKF